MSSSEAPPTPVRPRLSVLVRVALIFEILAAYGVVHWQLRRHDLPAVVAALRAGGVARRPLPSDDRRLAGIAVRVLTVLPGDARCLVRSLVVLRLLARRGIDVRLIIAAQPAPTFEAHAWVERAGRPLLPTRGFGDARSDGALIAGDGARSASGGGARAADRRDACSAPGGRRASRATARSDRPGSGCCSELERQRLVRCSGGRILERRRRAGPHVVRDSRASGDRGRADGGHRCSSSRRSRCAAALESAGVANVAAEGPAARPRAARRSRDAHVTRHRLLVGRADVDAAVRRLETARLAADAAFAFRPCMRSVAHDRGPGARGDPLATALVRDRVRRPGTGSGRAHLRWTPAPTTRRRARCVAPVPRARRLRRATASIDAAAWWDVTRADGSSLLEPLVRRHPALAAGDPCAAPPSSTAVSGVPAPSLVAAPSRVCPGATRRAVGLANPLMRRIAPSRSPPRWRSSDGLLAPAGTRTTTLRGGCSRPVGASAGSSRTVARRRAARARTPHGPTPSDRLGRGAAPGWPMARWATALADATPPVTRAVAEPAASRSARLRRASPRAPGAARSTTTQ